MTFSIHYRAAAALLGAALLLLLSAFAATDITAQAGGTVRGRVLNQQTGEPIPFATVAVHRVADSTLVTGALTDAQGRFEIAGVPAGEVYLKVGFMGYVTQSSQPFRSPGVVDRGDIALSASALMLEGLQVTASEAASMHRVDRQVFDAGQFQSAQGGTAKDVLRNLPSVAVNAQGEVSVRGATGFTVMVNGKPVQGDPGVVLEQLAANAIDDIEVLTAPSAKYDPDGKAGIINIKTRQRSALDGFFLVANAHYGLPSIEPYGNAEAAVRFGGDVATNYRSGRWDLSAGLDFRRNDDSGQRIGYVNTYLNGIFTEFPSYGERSHDRQDYTGRASVIFAPTERQSIGASFYAGKRTVHRTADILYDYQQQVAVPESQFPGATSYYDLYRRNGTVNRGGAVLDSLTYFNANLRVRRGDFLIGALDYSLQFGDGSDLKLAALYEHTLLGGPTDNIHLGGPRLADTLQAQFNDNDNPLDGVRLQLDYGRALRDARWESGYQYRYLRHPGDFVYLERDLAAGQWVVDPEFTNSIELTRGIHSVYSQLSGEWDRLTYTAGLRVEYADRRVRTGTPDTTFVLEMLNPYPSVNLQYDLGNELFARGGYSRRIERTTTFKMTPFPEREHSETLEQGDAELMPEFIDLAELGLVKRWGESSAFATGYLRDVRNVINRVNTIYDATALNRIYTNAGDARAAGLEAGTVLHPADWWRLTLGGNLFNYRIRGDLFGDRIDTSSNVYTVNVNSAFQLSSTLSTQFALNYLSEQVTAQGVDSRYYNPSLTLQKSFLNDRLALTAQWINMDMGLLESNEQRITTWRRDFYTTTNYVHEVDMLTIGLRYRLNQPSKKMKLIDSEFGKKEF